MGRDDRTLSLVLPMVRGTTPDAANLRELRLILDELGTLRSTQVVLSGGEDDVRSVSRWVAGEGPGAVPMQLVQDESDDWGELARAGLSAASGDELLVLDIRRQYASGSLAGMLEAVAPGGSELAVAVPPPCESARFGLGPLQGGLGLASRLVLGSSDVFSGLFAMRRSLWERGGRRLSPTGPSLVLELLTRRPARCVDVPVAVGPGFRRQRIGPRHLRPLKHVLDARFGSFSRLIQFCCVGASGMVIDLTLYALFQWLLSFTALAGASSTHFGFSWLLAISAALSISMALLWNFTLNRRLTFNDARGASWIRQFVTYALSNALAVALNFSVRLYLPTRIGFFARHRLAAAVVGIVAATGVSFSMSRWLVFARRPEPAPSPHINGHAPVGQSSVLA